MPGSTLRASWPLLIVIAVSIAVYGNTLPGRFVVDDHDQILNNPLITEPGHVPEILTTGVWEYEGRISSYYRPLMHLLYMGVYLLAGPRPWAFHLLNIALHSAVSALVYLILVTLLRRAGAASPTVRAAPLLAALVFATHPIHTEAVAWIAGITDLSATFFFLLAFHLYLIRRDAAPRTCLALSLASYFLATLCKEPAVTLPAVIIAYDLLVDPAREAWSRSARRWGAFAVTAGAYLALRVHALHGFAPAAEAAPSGASHYVINALALFLLYLEKLVWPVDLNFWHVFEPPDSPFSPGGLTALGVAAGFAGALWLSWRRSRIALAGLLLIAIPLAPALYTPALTQGLGQAFTERYLYLPSFGLVVLVAAALAWMERRGPRWRSRAVVAALLVIGVLGVGTVRRNPVWRDASALWGDAVRKSPRSPVAHKNYGFALLFRGREQEGKEHLRIALELKPDLANASVNKGLAYGRARMTKQAILAFHEALALDPDSVPANYYLGIAYEDQGWSDLAIARYERAIELQPGFAAGHNNLGVAYARKGLMDRARAHFEEAARLDPDDPGIRENLRRARQLDAEQSP